MSEVLSEDAQSGARAEIERFSLASGERTLSVVLSDEYGLEIKDISRGREVIRNDPEGGRFFVDELRQLTEVAPILEEVKRACILYYTDLFDLEQWQLTQQELDESIKGLLQRLPRLEITVWKGFAAEACSRIIDILDGLEVDELTQRKLRESIGKVRQRLPPLKITGYTEFIRQLSWELILAYGLSEARKEILERFALNADDTYLGMVERFLNVLINESDFLSEHPDKEGLFYNASAFSWRLRTSKSTLYDPRFAFERQELHRLFINRWGGLVPAMLGVDPSRFSIATYMGCGGGTGKTKIIFIRSLVDEKQEMIPWTSEGIDLLKVLGPIRNRQWERVEECKRQMDAVEGSDKYAWDELLKRNFAAYMSGRLYVAGELILEYLDYLSLLSPQNRSLVSAHVDTMGLACFCSDISRLFVNDLLDQYPDFKEALFNDAVVQIPRGLREWVVYLIMKEHYGLLIDAIEKTGRPVFVLDIPVKEAIARSSEEDEFRSRHDIDRLSLRFLALLCREILPNDVAIVRCAIEDGNKPPHYLTRVQTACACDIAEAFLRIGSTMPFSPPLPTRINNELGNLKVRVKIMQDNLKVLV